MSSLNIIVFAIGLALAIFGLRHRISNIDFDRLVALSWVVPIAAPLLPLVLLLTSQIFSVFSLTVLSAYAIGMALVLMYVFVPLVGFAGLIILSLNYWGGQINFRQRHIRLAVVFTCIDIALSIPVITFIIRILFYGLPLDS